MRKILMLMVTLLAMPMTALAAGIEVDEKTLFEGNFTIDSMHTKDSRAYELSASGDAGP